MSAVATTAARPRCRPRRAARVPLALDRPRDRARRRDHGSARQHGHHHRRPDRPRRARRRHVDDAVVGRRLHPRVRRPHDRRRASRRHLRPSEGLHRRHRRLHARLDGVRARAVAGRAHRVPRPPGRVRRAADPAGPGRHQDRLPAEGDGRRVRRVRARDGPGRDRRADPRRLARHRRPARHRLADDLPHQRPARRRRPARRAAVHAGVALGEPHPPRPGRRRPHQLRGAVPDLPPRPGPRARLAAVDVRPHGRRPRAHRRLRRGRAPFARHADDRAEPAAQPRVHVGPARRARVLRRLRGARDGHVAVLPARAALLAGARRPDARAAVPRHRVHGGAPRTR